jgi:hypothetical protein
MLTWTRYVERHGGKIRNLAVACLLSAAALVAPLFVTGFWTSLAVVTAALSDITAARAIFWTIPPRSLSGMGAAAGLAFINSVGVMGGFVGPTMMGWLTDRTGSLDGARRDGGDAHDLHRARLVVARVRQERMTHRESLLPGPETKDSRVARTPRARARRRCHLEGR